MRVSANGDPRGHDDARLTLSNDASFSLAMNRKNPIRTEPSAPLKRPAPSEETAALALRHAATIMSPIARWLLRSGVSYGAFADALKTVFLDAARHELAVSDTPPTFSALSMLSGVHRKDVRMLATATVDTSASAAGRGIPLSSLVYTRWTTSRRYRAREGQPKALRRSGKSPSFESLSRELSQDVHPRTVLDELLRLGLVALSDDGETVVPVSLGFTPSTQLEELTALVAANTADHLLAAVHNLSRGAPPFLEHSIFADGLGPESIEVLRQHALALWLADIEKMVASATHRVELDDSVPPELQHRMRFGVYFYSEPQSTAKTVSVAKPVSNQVAAKKTRTRRLP